jgi:prophage antirepressor-like protein
MSKIIPFEFDKHGFRVVTDVHGEPGFVADDIATILGYSEASSMTRHLDDDEKGLSIVQTPGGEQQMLTINESGLYSAILRSRKPEAKRFKRWVTHDVLPAIRKTGSYQVPEAPHSSPKLEAEMAGAELYARLLRPAPSSQVAMIAKIVENNGGDPRFLPAYTIDAAPDQTGGSSMPTKPLSALLADHGSRLSATAFNKLLAAAGYLEERTRPSSSARGGVKRFWAITDAGLRFGKNLTSPNNPRETQPHWYIDRFSELLELTTVELA